jgi:pathogenesis-related protein 1
MKTFWSTLFVLVIVVSATYAQPGKTSAKACPGKNGLTAAEIAELVEAHNSARAEHKLPPLTWDCNLADIAQEWATRGIFEHRTNPKYGESIFVSGSAKAKADSAVGFWMQERSSWDDKSAKCAGGKVCTHYTQVMWKKTTAIGCGINRNAPGKWRVLLVCNYEPAGNRGGPPF